MYIYLIITLVVVLFGAVATVMIGNSKENKEENTAYDKKTGEYWIRLSVVYGVSIVLGIVVFLLYMFK
jgi:NADH:ubiquinone oxidoreductase subunit 3 (subunit A)